MEPSTQIETPGIPQLIQAAIMEHEQCEAHMESCVDHAVACGRHLGELRKLVPDSNWQDWCRNHLPLSMNTIWRYIKGAERFDASYSSLEFDHPHRRRLTLKLLLEEDQDIRKSLQEEKDSQIIDSLMKGTGYSIVTKELHVNRRRVLRLYETHVLPVLLSEDWVSTVLTSRISCKPLVAARLQRVISAHRDRDGEKMTPWQVYASARCQGLTPSLLDAARAVITHGCAQVIQRCEDETMSLSAAREIVRHRDHDTQRKLLMQEKIRQQSTVLDDAKQMAIRMLDQVLNWRQLHPGGVRELAEVEPDNEVDCKEVISNLEHIAEFCLDVAASLTAGVGNVYARQQNGKLPQPDGSKV